MKILKRTSKFLKNLSIMGNAGVGTDAPTKELDVNGDMKVSVVPSNNSLTEVLVADADGNIFKRELSTLFNDDIVLDTAIYDDETNILTLTMSNGVQHPIDLNDLVDITVGELADADGDTKVFIEELAGGDFVHVQVAGTDAARLAKDNAEFKKLVKFEKGYAVALRNVNATGNVTNEDHTLIVDATVANITLTLPAISSVKAGKVYEFKIKNGANSISIAPSGSNEIEGETSFTLNHKFVRFQADATNSNWVLLEEVRAGGYLIEEVAPNGGTTKTYTELVGFDISNFDLMRDGLVESSITEYSFDPVTGTITVNEAFEQELIQIRLN